jgi:hypothetical protein
VSPDSMGRSVPPPLSHHPRLDLDTPRCPRSLIPPGSTPADPTNVPSRGRHAGVFGFSTTVSPPSAHLRPPSFGPRYEGTIWTRTRLPLPSLAHPTRFHPTRQTNSLLVTGGSPSSPHLNFNSLNLASNLTDYASYTTTAPPLVHSTLLMALAFPWQASIA